MDKHTCKQCGKVFKYCRGCVFKPIPYKAAGFCSKECSAEFKKPKVEEVELPTIEEEVVFVEENIPEIEEIIQEMDVEVVVENDEDMTISEDE